MKRARASRIDFLSYQNVSAEGGMDIPKQSRADRYESFYREVDSPLMQKIRRETFGEDIGLHSWGSAQEMRTDIARLNLSSSSRIVDLGCGPLRFH